MGLLIYFVVVNLFYFVAAYTICDPCDFNRTYRNFSQSILEPIRYKFQINDSSQVVRVWVQSKNATTHAPLLLVVRETRAIMSWQVPLGINSNRYTFDTVSRTLCPVNETSLHTASISVELSSSSQEPVHFALNASLVENFYLQMRQRRYLVTTPSEPQFVAFIMPDGVDTVLVRMTSSDQNCMYVSVQDIQCPVFDLDTNVQYSGQYQTVSTRGAITVSRSKLKQFYIVFVMKANDVDCYPDRPTQIIPSGSDDVDDRSKMIQVWVEPTLNETGYILALATTAGVFAAIYFVALGLSILIDMKYSN